MARRIKLTGKHVSGEWFIPSSEGRSHPIGDRGQVERLKQHLLRRIEVLRATS